MHILLLALLAAPRVQPWHDPAAPVVTAAANPHLNYYGGRILDHVKVYAVNWGPSVNSTVASGIGDFYGAITSSQMYDWLSEYSTNLSGGTNQSLGHGTFAGSFTITPSNTGTSLTDAQIQTELKAQISAGHVPANDAQSLYMINFPPGVKISLAGSGSCVSGGFCAYHSTISGSPNLRYGVLPDMSPGSGCDVGCGHAATMFDNFCSVASHELVEATTDPDVGLAISYGPPLGWYDPQSGDGEIGDICNGQQATFSSNGATYTVQKEWSNLSGKCVGVTDSDAFKLTVSPASQSLAAGGSVSFNVGAAVLRGAAQSVALSIAGLPSGAAAQLTPSTISTGGTATLQISASSSVTNGSYTFTVSGAGSNSSATATGTISVSGGSGGCPAGYHESGGVCVPDGGCSTQAAGLALAPLALLALLFRRRRA